MKATLQTLLPTGLLKSTNTDDKKIDYPYSSEIMRLKSVLYEASNCGWTNKYLILLRGLPGSGKSTLAR
ncbi:unnamed protein product [Trichobilharzia regenti]|nr:unnamed protein product [Trichobilharzia regenti]